MAQIRLRDLHKTFGDFVAVRDSSASPSRTVSSSCLLGPSGCGKTTTLRMIAGLELPTSGAILLDGEDVTFKRASERDIAFVFQLFALYPHMNVRRNIGFPLARQGMPQAEIRQRVEEAAKLLRIDHLLDRAGIRPRRRRPPAGGARPRDRARARGVHDGRAAGRARCRSSAHLMCDELARPARPASRRRRSTSPTTSSRRWRWPIASR